MALSALLRFWALDAGLPHLLTRPDEEVVLFQSRVPASGSWDLSHNVYQYGVYSSPYVFLSWAWAEVGLNAVHLLGFFPDGNYLSTIDREPWRILLLLRSLSAAAGVLAVAALMFFMQREVGRTAALVAGLILATSFLHVRESHAAKPDAAMTLGVVISLGLMAPLARGATLMRAACVGISIGLAMAMKHPAVLLLVPAWVMCAVGSDSRSWRRLVPVTAFVVLAAAALAFVGSSPDVLVNQQTRSRVLSIVALVLPSLVPDQLMEMVEVPHVPVVPGFERPDTLWSGWEYYYLFALRYGAGLLALVAVPLGFLWAFVSRRPLAVAAAVFGVVSLAAIGAALALQSRYLTPAIPSVAIVLAVALVDMARRLPRTGRVLVVWVGALLLVAEPLGRAVAYDRLIARPDTRVLAGEWLSRNAVEEGGIVMVGTVMWGWGEPQVPPSLRLARIRPPSVAELHAQDIDWIVAHDHEVFSSRVDPELLESLLGEFEMVYEIDPFVAPRSEAHYEVQDAYYAPIAGFSAVSRPGPWLRIFRRRDPGPQKTP